MRFRFHFFGVEIVSLELAWPARGLYPVPEAEDISSEWEIDEINAFFAGETDEDEE